MVDDLIILGLLCGGGLLALCAIDWVLSVTLFKPEELPHDHSWCGEAYVDVPWCEVCQAPHWYGQCPVRIVPQPPYNWEDEGVMYGCA